MSPPNVPLSLSPAAQQDLIDILRYTGESWGKDQLLAYGDKLNGALVLISQNPKIGRNSTELPDTHRIYFVGSHVIVYRTSPKAIEVIRILHQRMSISKNV